jgi:catechol 2,3-dioxygenase-like lactoylglutathione lyase family enzyme
MEPMSSKTNFEVASPILRVANLAASLRYYTEALGFQQEWGGDDFACVTRDNVAIYLAEGDQGQPGTWAWIGVGDVTTLYEEYKASGAKILGPIESFPWALELKVGDPDGHVLRFGSDPDESSVSRKP